MYILLFTFFGSLLRSREVPSATFCIVEKTLPFIVSFLRGTLGYSAAREQEASLKAVQYYSGLNLYCWWETIRPYFMEFKIDGPSRSYNAQVLFTQ